MKFNSGGENEETGGFDTAGDGRVQHDRYYIRNWSIWFDIEIIVRTILTVLRKAY